MILSLRECYLVKDIWACARKMELCRVLELWDREGGSGHAGLAQGYSSKSSCILNLEVICAFVGMLKIHAAWSLFLSLK